MNLRDLKNFITYQMDDRLTECGIDVNQITQIKILDCKFPSDRKFPSDENVVWITRPFDSKLDYETVITMLQRWITNRIVGCYMTDNLDIDLAIEIMGNGKGMMAI